MGHRRLCLGGASGAHGGGAGAAEGGGGRSDMGWIVSLTARTPATLCRPGAAFCC